MKPDMATGMHAFPTLLIAAGGTGGHIFPGLAVASVMRERGWRVVWLGHPERMEGKLVPQHGIELLALRFAGLRGKGWRAWLKLPFTLLGAVQAARAALKQTHPDVVLGLGGYVAFPAGLAARLRLAPRRRVPLVIHEQNAVAGSSNRHLARWAQAVLTGFPGVLAHAQVVGNPVGSAFVSPPEPAQRLGTREGPLRLLVVGGSLGARVLNEVVPAALVRVPDAQRPEVRHQCGAGHLEATEAAYRQGGVPATCEPFIERMVDALAWADVVVCRAGAMTVAEVAALGVAALFIPLPHAIDDHQRANARFLADCGSAWMQAQKDFTPEWLGEWLMERTRPQLMQVAQRARQHARPHAAQQIADVCEEIAQKRVTEPGLTNQQTKKQAKKQAKGWS